MRIASSARNLWKSSIKNIFRLAGLRSSPSDIFTEVLDYIFKIAEIRIKIMRHAFIIIILFFSFTITGLASNFSGSQQCGELCEYCITDKTTKKKSCSEPFKNGVIITERLRDLNAAFAHNLISFRELPKNNFNIYSILSDKNDSLCENSKKEISRIKYDLEVLERVKGNTCATDTSSHKGNSGKK